MQPAELPPWPSGVDDRARAEEISLRLLELLRQLPANILILRGEEHHIELASLRAGENVALAHLHGKPLREALPALAAQGVVTHLDQVYRTGKPFIGDDVRILFDHRGDGVLETAYHKIVFLPTHTPRGEIDGILIFGGENTEMVQMRQHRRELEREAAERATLLSTVIEAIADNLVVYDAAGNRVLMNSAARTYFEQTLPGVTNRQPLPERATLLHALDVQGRPLDSSQEPVARILQGETLSHDQAVDVRIRPPQGEERWFNTGGAPLRDEAGRITGAVVTARDVTWRHHLEQRMQANEWKYRCLTEAGIIGVIIIDMQGRIHETNSLFAQMVGYSKEELLSGAIGWSQLTPAEFLKQEAWIRPMLSIKGEVQPYEKEYQRKDGSRFPALVTGAMIDQDAGLAVGLVLDIADRQAAERRKQEFLGMVSHELRTPLTVVQGTLELIEILLQRIPISSTADAPALRGKLEQVLQQAKRQMNIEQRLVEALLDVSRLEANHFELVLQRHNLAQIVEQTVELQQQLASARQLVLSQPAQECVEVQVDADRIGQALTNYLSNALKYSPPDQPVVIRLELLDATGARVSVSNRGQGLSAEQQQRVWERFYRAETQVPGQYDNTAGLGLGLSIVKTIIEQHHGQVGVESQPGGETIFWFSLPLAPEPV